MALSYKEKRKLLRKLESLYRTDPEFRGWVDEVVEGNLRAMHIEVYGSHPLLSSPEPSKED